MREAPFSIRIPSELMDKLKGEAQKDGRTVGNLIVHILKKNFTSKPGK